MSPTAHLGHATRSLRLRIAVQRVVAGIAIRLKVAFIPCKMGCGMLAAATGREAEHHGRWAHVAARTAVA